MKLNQASMVGVERADEEEVVAGEILISLRRSGGTKNEARNTKPSKEVTIGIPTTT